LPKKTRFHLATLSVIQPSALTNALATETH